MEVWKAVPHSLPLSFAEEEIRTGYFTLLKLHRPVLLGYHVEWKLNLVAGTVLWRSVSVSINLG